MMGVYSRDYVEPMANVLKNLGLKKALVVHGSDGLDEITTTDKTFICEFSGSEIISYDIDPEELGFQRATEEDLKGGELEDNVKIVEDILNGIKGPKRDIVVINAAYALYASAKIASIEAAIEMVVQAIDSGDALRKLNDLKGFTQNVS